MNVTLRQLRVFECAARLLNFTRTAEELHLSQPAVSMQIKEMEENVGLPLFERIGNKLFLTHAGKEFQHYARVIFQQLDEAQGVFDEIRGLRRGRLELAVVSTANSFATQLLATFSQQYPFANISLDVTNRENLVRMLEANERDLVIMGRPPESLDVELAPFLVNPLVVVANPSHPLAGKRNIPVEALNNQTFVIREAGSGTRIAMEKHFSEHGVSFVPGMEMTSAEAIKQAVQANLGLAVASSHTLALELETGRLVILDVQGFPLLRHWHIVHCKGKRLSPVAKAFQDFVLKEAERLLPAPDGKAPKRSVP
ncbi:MAG: LysR family transcriptional regulator [Chromatiales bacterium]|nr:LysR family transcriptional regulator [Chromatiales bacterium]